MMNWYEEEMKRRDDESLRYVMADKKGRWFMMRLLDAARINEPTFAKSALFSAYNEGRRAVGIKYVKKLTQDTAHIELKQLAEKEYTEIKERLIEEERSMHYGKHI